MNYMKRGHTSDETNDKNDDGMNAVDVASLLGETEASDTKWVDLLLGRNGGKGGRNGGCCEHKLPFGRSHGASPAAPDTVVAVVS